MKQFLIILFGASILVSCRKEELPVQPFPRGDLFTGIVNMTPLYGAQAYYDLETNSVVASNQKMDWELSFACETDKNEIRLNSSRYMAVWKTGFTNLNDVSDTLGANWAYDGPSGSSDSLAITNWQDGSVFVLDLGYSPTGVHQGFVKCIFVQNGQAYEVVFSNLDGSGLSTYTVLRDPLRNFVQFSFHGGGVSLHLEPEKENWDLWFTQYTHIYPDGEQYLVVGVLTNPYQTQCVQFNDVPFQDVSVDMAEAGGLSNQWDIIGFDWKDYNFDISAFDIADSITYVIKTSDMRYFKLRFIDFYDQMGNKGVPTFEVKEL